MNVLMAFATKNSLLVGVSAGALILLIAFLIYLISVITGKEFAINVGPVKFKTGGKQKTKEVFRCDVNKCMTVQKIKATIETANVEENTTVVMDLIADISSEKTNKIDKIEMIETISRQMVAMEDVNVRIKQKVTKVYADLLQAKLTDNSNAKQHREYKYYQVVLGNILEDLKKTTLKQSLQVVNLPKLTDEEFASFVNQKTEIMVSILIEYLDFVQNPKSLVDVNDLHKANESLMPEIADIVKSLFRQIKGIMQKDSKIVKEIELKFKDDLKAIRDRVIQINTVQKIKEIIT